MSSQQRATLFATLCLLIASAAGLKYSGSVTGLNDKDKIAYVAKFCFGKGSSAKLEVDAHGEPHAAQFMIFDDEGWSKVLDTDNCTLQKSYARPWGREGWVPLEATIGVSEHYNRWWYATFVNCSGSFTIPHYYLEFVNDGGNQLSLQQQGLQSLYTFYWVVVTVLLIAIAGLPLGRQFFSHTMGKYITAALVFEWISRLFLMCYYWHAKNSGYTVLGLLGFGEWLNEASQACLIAHALLVATGWNFTSMPMANKVALLGGVVMYLVLGLALLSWGTMVHDEWWFRDTLLATPLGIVLTTVRLVILGGFVFFLFFRTIPATDVTEKAQWYKLFFFTSVAWQTLYVIFAYSSNGLLSYDQAKFTWASLTTFNTLYYFALIFLCLPSRIGGLFGAVMGDEGPRGFKGADPTAFIDESSDAPRAEL